jgi:O-antigen/teichoic acid export membrane protein
MTIESEEEEVLIQEEAISPARHLEKKALKGTYYIIIFYAIANALRLVSSIVLTHLFTPDYFGVMQLMTVVLVGLTLFSHIGLGDSVIQSPRGDEPVFLNTVWTLQVMRGVGLWLMTLLLAWPVAIFYRESRIIWLLPVLGFGCVIAGFSSTSLLSLSRHMGIGKTSSQELLSQAVQFVVTIIWAKIQPSLWALVAGRIASEVFRTVFSYFIMPELRPRFTWDKECVRAILGFGKWIMLGSALAFLAQQSDRLILGKLIPIVALGVYGIAYGLSDLPRNIISMFTSRVGYPFIAKFAQRPREEYRAIVLKYRRPILAVGGLLLICMINLGDVFVLHVYKKPYHDASWMVCILAAGLWHTLLYSTSNQAILALGKAHYSASSNLVYCIGLFVLIPVGFHFYGIAGAVIAVAISDVPVYFVILHAAYREKVGMFFQDLWMTAGFATALGATLFLRVLLGFGLPFHGIHS